MSSRDYESGSAGMSLAGLVIFAYLLFAVVAFISFVLTVLSLFAWRRPLNIGQYVITPEEAHGFVYSGLAGMVLVPLFVGFCSAFFGFHPTAQIVPYLFFGGYVVGSLWFGMLCVAREESLSESAPSTQVVTSAPQRILTEPVRRDFEYATWDDEELR